MHAAAAERLREQLAERTAQVEGQSEVISDLRHVVKGHQGEVEKLQGSLAEAEQKTTEAEQELSLLRPLSGKVAALEASLLERDGRVKDLEVGALASADKIQQLEQALAAKDEALKTQAAELARVCKVAESVEGLREQAVALNVEMEQIRKESTNLRDERERARSDADWLRSRGIGYSIAHVLRSEDFVRMNMPVHLACRRVGQHQGCLETRNKLCPDVPIDELPYQHPGAEEEASTAMAQLMKHEFPFVRALRSGQLTLELLRETLSKYESKSGSSSRSGGKS